MQQWRVNRLGTCSWTSTSASGRSGSCCATGTPGSPTPFDAVLASEGIRILLISVRAPRVNAFAERWVGTVRRELLDRMLILGRRQLESALSDYVTHYNGHRPHRSLGQAPPLGAVPPPAPAAPARVLRHDRLGGLIHEYARVA